MLVKVIPPLRKIINVSFLEGEFPSQMIETVIRLLVKKLSLDMRNLLLLILLNLSAVYEKVNYNILGG